MAILTMDNLLKALSEGKRQNIYKSNITSEGPGTFSSLIKASGYPSAMAANPPIGNGGIPTKDDIYTLNFTDRKPGNGVYVGRMNLANSSIGSIMIYDRVWHNSGLVGNITTDQFINSIPLTRYTSGIGIEIYGEVYTAMGATGATFSVTYIDSNDIERVGTYVQPANALSVGQMFPFSPPTGAIGVKSITSVKLSATTGTAGNFGITLVRRLIELPISIANVPTVLDAFQLGLPDLEVGSALCLMTLCTGTATGNIVGSIDIIEG